MNAEVAEGAENAEGDWVAHCGGFATRCGVGGVSLLLWARPRWSAIKASLRGLLEEHLRQL